MLELTPHTRNGKKNLFTLGDLAARGVGGTS